MLKWVTVFSGFLIAAAPALGDEGSKVVGTWRLVSFENEFHDGSERRPMYGKNPTGYVIFTAEGRMMAIVEAEGRKAPQTDEERAIVFRTMIAYTGIYRLEDDKWVMKNRTWSVPFHAGFRVEPRSAADRGLALLPRGWPLLQLLVIQRGHLGGQG